MKLQFNVVRSGLLFIAFLALGNFAMAQRMVKGKVSDADSGEALIGASVAAVGTTRGTVTDIDGNYSLDVPAGVTQLRISYTGYAEQSVTLGAANVVDVKLAGGTILDEVVVVGYGSLKAKEVTSAVSTVKVADFNKGNITDVAQLLQGKVAGLSIARPGSDPNGSFNIRLRGLSTVSQNTSPLIIVDGVPVANLNLVDPQNIESFDVLKDGSASAIYGTRASSGVIIITTKKGMAGKSEVEYNGSVSFDQIANGLDLLSGADFVKNAGGTDLGSNTDWMKEVSRTGLSHKHNIAFGGGAGKMTYRTSLSYQGVQGIAKGSDFGQVLANISLTQKALDDRITFSANLGATQKDANRGFTEAFRYAAVYNPTAPILSDKPEYAATGGYYQAIGSFDQFNPVAIIEQNINKRVDLNQYGNLKMDVALGGGLSAAVFYSVIRDNRKDREYYDKQSFFRGGGGRGSGVAVEENWVTSLVEGTVNYNKEFGKLGFKALAGYSFQDFDHEGFGTQAGDILLDELGIDNLGAFVDYYNGLAIPSSIRDAKRLIAGFGRVQMNYDDTYFMTASLRREGSSRFGANNKWGLFPAVSVGVQLANLLNISTFNSLKARVGYGVTGAEPSESYLSLQKFGPLGSFFYSGGSYKLAYGPSGTNANPDLKWEQKSDINVGVDFALMDYRLTGNLDFYTTTTTDLLYPFDVPVPPNFASQTWLNVGELKNSGLELGLNYSIWDTRDKSWSSGLTFSTYKTELTDLNQAGATRDIANVGAPGLNNEYYVRLEEGQPIGQLYVRDFLRISDGGDYVFTALAGGETTDPKLAAYKVAGQGLPKFDVGFTNNFGFGNWDVQVFFRGLFGHSLANEYRVFYESNDPGTKTWNKIATKYYDTKLKAANAPSSYHVEKADYFKLDNLTLGYNVKLGAASAFNKARLFVNGQNLFVITGYTGVDPEVRYSDPGSVDNGNREAVIKNPLAPGIDRRSTYFRARTFTVGVNLGF